MMGNTGMRTLVFALAAIGIAACTTTSKKDVVDTIASTGDHKTLTQAIKASGLESTLRDKGPYTVMAPTDEAFALLPKNIVAALMRPENKAQLAQLLEYHVIPGNNSAEWLTQTRTLADYSGGVQNMATPSGVRARACPTCGGLGSVQSLAGGGNVALFNNSIPWKTAANAEVTVAKWDGSVDGVWVNNFAVVTDPDIKASNGVVHSIDRVLLPQAPH